MPLSRSNRTNAQGPKAEAFTPTFEFPPGHEAYRPELAPNVGATQDVAALLGGSREMPAVMAVSFDNTPSTEGCRGLQLEGRRKAHELFAAAKQSAAAVWVIEQMCGLPLGNDGFRPAAEPFLGKVPEGNGSPLGNALHQQLDALEHFIRSAARLGNPVHAVVFAPALDWVVNCEPASVIRDVAARVSALAKKVGKRFFVQPVAVGDGAALAVAELFAFQRKVLRLEEVDHARFYAWLVECSRRASRQGGDFSPPAADFLKPVK